MATRPGLSLPVLVRASWLLLVLSFTLGWFVRGLLFLEVSLKRGLPLLEDSRLVWADVLLPLSAVLLPALVWTLLRKPHSAWLCLRSDSPPSNYRGAPNQILALAPAAAARRAGAYIVRLVLLLGMILWSLPWNKGICFHQVSAAACGTSMSSLWETSWPDFVGVSALWLIAILFHSPTERRLFGPAPFGVRGGAERAG